MTELFVVRHGETITNAEHRINGSLTDKPLNKKGIQQAENLSKKINIDSFDEIYTSPLIRAKKTAQILSKGHQQIHLDDRLKEVNYGSWDGVVNRGLMEKYPDAFNVRHFVTESYTKYAINAEEYEHVYARISDFINDMAKKNDKRILVVCHGFISVAFFKVVTNVPSINNILQPDNLGVSKYLIDSNGESFLSYYGRLDHID
ncbi:histidine phosphatase family protein [Companilactobacillus zhachilii]|uniref:histidine phosphatase family protein n=1 Tax=Companilactobacillus zhachilii TaxID=2304606 RepID=UPI004033E9F9